MSTPIRLAILGATGSIGRQALDVVRAQPDRLRLVALGANRNADALHDLAMEFPTARTALGPDALVALATEQDADVILVATPGVAALRATVAALEARAAEARVAEAKRLGFKTLLLPARGRAALFSDKEGAAQAGVKILRARTVREALAMGLE